MTTILSYHIGINMIKLYFNKGHRSNYCSRYDHEQDFAAFQQATHTCGVCLEDKPGREFYQLPDCKHHTCQDCMLAYCDMHVCEGTVQQLRCSGVAILELHIPETDILNTHKNSLTMIGSIILLGLNLILKTLLEK